MKVTVVATAIVAAGTANAACSNPKQAVEWRLMSNSQQNDYLTALKCVRGKPSNLNVKTNPKPTTAWEDLSWVHNTMALETKSIHNTAQFLPWHRIFLALHDKLLQNCGYTGPFPYWDWTIDSQAPEKAPVWNKFGNSPTGQVSMNIVGTLSSFVPGKKGKSVAVTRSWTGGKPGLMGSFYNSAIINQIMKSSNYDDFRYNLEGTPHNQVHNGIGGDMASLASPNDPIFYLHHRNIDRYWAKWQDKSAANLKDYSGSTVPGGGNNAAKSDVMNFLGLSDFLLGKSTTITINAALDIKSGGLNNFMCYNYQNSATASAISTSVVKRHKDDKSTPDAFDRSNKVNLRVPPPLPESYLRMMNYDDAGIARIREHESKRAKLIRFINSLPIEFSAALKNHELGLTYGWRQRTDAEKAERKTKLAKIVADFEAHGN